jgi:hypothetical protein
LVSKKQNDISKEGDYSNIGVIKSNLLMEEFGNHYELKKNKIIKSKAWGLL